MILEIKVPSPGESINEVEISNWLVSDGDYVEKDQEICEIDSDKATLTVSAEDSGKIKLFKDAEITISVGDVICTIDTAAKNTSPKNKTVKKEVKVVATSSVASPAAKKIMREENIYIVTGTGKGGRITKQDVLKGKPAMGVGPGKRNQTKSRGRYL